MCKWCEKLTKKEIIRDNSPNIPISTPIVNWAKQIIVESMRELSTVGHGSRNNETNKIAFRIGTLVARGVLNEDLAYQLLEAACNKWYELDSNVDMDLTSQTITNGLTAGMSRPWEPWPPVSVRTMARADKLAASTLAKCASKLATARNTQERVLRKHAYTLGQYGAVGAIAKEAARKDMLNASEACGLVPNKITREEAGVAFDEAWSQGGTNPVEWPPVDPTDSDPRPGWQVRIGDGKFADELRAVLGRGPLSGMYNQNGRMIRCIAVGEKGYIEPEEGEGSPYQTHEADTTYLRSLISRKYFVFVEHTDANGEPHVEHVMPPEDPTKIVLSEIRELPWLPKLDGIIHSPLLRTDGSVLNAPGYDAATRLLMLPTSDMAISVPENVTEEDVIQARDLILQMLAEFPFVTGADRATYIAFLFTPLLRLLVPPPWPWLSLSAHEPGSGKTLLYKILNELYGGVLYSPPPNDEDETRKRLTAILRTDTAAIVVFDNVSKPLVSDTIAAFATTDEWGDRTLGLSESVKYKNDRIWVITGNNTVIGGDLPRRVAGCHIDAGVPRPWERTGFKLELPRWVEENRERVLSALLTLARGWVLAGQPTVEAGRSDFGSWVSNMRGLVLWAGIEGEVWPNDFVEETVERDNWGTLLAELESAFEHLEWFAAADVAWDCEHSLVGGIRREIPPELAELKGSSLSQALSKMFGARAGQWAGDFGRMRSLERTAKRIKLKEGISKGQTLYGFRVVRQPDWRDDDEV